MLSGASRRSWGRVGLDCLALINHISSVAAKSTNESESPGEGGLGWPDRFEVERSAFEGGRSRHLGLRS